MESETKTQLLITGITDEQLASAARETAAQATIIRVLKALPHERRPAVLEAVGLVIQADRLVPGFLDLVANRRRSRKPEGDGE